MISTVSMVLLSLTSGVAIATLIAAPITPIGIVPIGPVSSGSLQQNAFDNSRKGFNTDSNDHIDQTDATSSKQGFNRANTAQQASNDASLANGAFMGGASVGAQSKAFQNTFDNGAADNTAIRTVSQDTNAAAKALDARSTNTNVDTATAIGGVGIGSTGFSNRRLNDVQDQSLANSKSMDQSLYENKRASEQFDRGTNNRAAASEAVIGQGGLDGIGVGSQGAQSADFATTLDKGSLSSQAQHVATNQANNNDVLNNHAALQKDTTSSAAILTPFGSAGESAGRIASNQFANAQHHDDAAQSDLLQSDKKQQLASSWAQGSDASKVGIGSGLGGAASTGSSRSAAVNGFDNSFANDNALSAAKKSTETNSNTFDNHNTAQDYRSNAVIGGIAR